MASETQSAPKWMFWAGWTISVLLTLLLLLSGVMKFVKPPGFEEEFSKLQWDPSFTFSLGILEIACTVIYLFPRTAVLGAILLTGYLGGAIATHVRIHDAFFPQVILGVLVWGGIYLRDAKLRALIPWRCY